MVLAVVQARASSSRLPGKVLKPLLGKPMLLRELERVQRSRLISKVVVATSTDASDDAVADQMEDEGFAVFRGELDDVLDRFFQCAKEYTPEHVVRITGDCPLIDWRVIDDVVRKHLEEGNDYTATTEHFPDGLDTEVMQQSVLEAAWKNARMSSEREHVTLYIKKHGEQFRLGWLEADADFSCMRWTVDEQQDFVFVQHVFEELYPVNPDFGMEAVMQLLKRKPQLCSINQGIQRNEGLLKSLASDRMVSERKGNENIS